MAPEEEHRPTMYGGREVCTCGDFNCASLDARDSRQARTARQAVYGMCTGCGSVEVALLAVSGARDLSGMGESAAYPTGRGCEVCA